ncbi:kinesin-like protein KIN-14I isoform X2 [Rosa chinensis]|uniref:kinesin-like protein KIN-14I isoform X2 n=1 Tax=Rosa chinensis TaxID=74649 RepID=UPI001AD90936|nr:kinesin-like protein KIN-14I isoform X2 [Rosa chinensis]
MLDLRADAMKGFFGEPFLRKNSEPFMSSFTRTLSWSERSQDSFSSEDPNEANSSHSLHMLVREVLLDKKQEEIPFIVESMLSKVMEEFQHRLASQTELVKAPSKDSPGPDSESPSLSEHGSDDIKNEEKAATQIKKDDCCNKTYDHQEGSKGQFVRHKMLVEQQKKNIQELKHNLYDTKAGMKFLQMKYQEDFNRLGMHLHGLAHAASGYQKVLEENRKLYNLVQDLKETMCKEIWQILESCLKEYGISCTLMQVIEDDKRFHIQVYLDFGLAIPKLSVQGMVSSLKELLELAPIKKETVQRVRELVQFRDFSFFKVCGYVLVGHE